MGSTLGNEVLATALLDRLLHHAEAISIHGQSYRMRNRLATSKSKAGGQPARKGGTPSEGRLIGDAVLGHLTLARITPAWPGVERPCSVGIRSERVEA